MANGDSVGDRDTTEHAHSVTEEKERSGERPWPWQGGRVEERALTAREVAALVRESLDNHEMMKDLRNKLADNPAAMADAIIDLEDIQRYMLWGLAVLGFLVWILLISRGPKY